MTEAPIHYVHKVEYDIKYNLYDDDGSLKEIIYRLSHGANVVIPKQGDFFSDYETGGTIYEITLVIHSYIYGANMSGVESLNTLTHLVVVYASKKQPVVS